MAIFNGVFNVGFNYFPSGVSKRRKIGLDGAEPFRQPAEVRRLGAEDFAPVLVQQSSHFGRASDSFVSVGVQHSSKRVSGSREEGAKFLGNLLFPVIVKPAVSKHLLS